MKETELRGQVDNLCKINDDLLRAARVEVLRAVMAEIPTDSEATHPIESMQREYFRSRVNLIASRFNIAPEELEEKKPITTADIMIDWHDFVADGKCPRVVCRDWAWDGKAWTKGSGHFFRSLHDAEAIRDRLVRENNVPGEKL